MPLERLFIILSAIFSFAKGNVTISTADLDIAKSFMGRDTPYASEHGYLSSNNCSNLISIQSSSISSFPEADQICNLTAQTPKRILVVGIKEHHKNYTILSIGENSKIRELESGRLFFFKGLKKMMWGFFVGLQIVKTILLALFLPSILGSLGKVIGKGITTVSGFNQQSESVNGLNFSGDTYSLEETNGPDGYMYPQPEASDNNFVTQAYNPVGLNSRISSPMEVFSKNSNSNLVGSINKNNFKDFLDVPASSLLLTNYDPFYSPLLSRLDAVFQRLDLSQHNDEICREKIVCLMYANPAKYAPYSNLVSAQLSRELNELRKPTVNNPDILRFFKYMKAAKTGQDGTDCEDTYKECTGLQHTDSPVMLTTFNDINKLVQARNI